MYVAVTAGHVDHGKSALVRALTGTDPDRLAEEKRRGMTIELGHASTRLGSGCDVAFVDVPGHERFLGTMLAGAGPVPFAVFVVAADEGWQAQSTEHLEALEALGIGSGLLVVTKTDRADPAAALDGARRQLAPTGLSGVPGVCCSATTGEGIDDVRTALDEALSRLPPPVDTGRPRLWVDRAFSKAGAGTVVTGTLTDGALEVGDEVFVAPSSRPARVRALEVLGRRVDRAVPVGRTAVALRGVRAGEVGRGDALVPPGTLSATVVDVRLRPAAGAGIPRYALLYCGSAMTEARVRPLGPGHARLTFARPLPLRVGDRFVLRGPAARGILAGGLVLDVTPASPAGRGWASSRARELARTPVTDDGWRALRRDGFARSADLPAGPLPDGTRRAGAWTCTEQAWASWAERVAACLAGSRSRVSRSEVLARAGLPDQEVLDSILIESPGYRTDSVYVYLPLADGERMALERARPAMAERPFSGTSGDELHRLGVSAVALSKAVHDGLLLWSDGLFFLPGARARAVAALTGPRETFTVSEARQALGTNRRSALALLLDLEEQGLVERVDAAGRRRLRPPRP